MRRPGYKAGRIARRRFFASVTTDDGVGVDGERARARAILS